MNERIAGGKYRLLRLLGKGAFAEVYLAADTAGRYYACKISKNTEMLMKEAEIQRQVKHELFPKYAEHGTEKGSGWLMMEYVQGENLERIIRSQGCFSSQETAEIGQKLANGIRYLHERQRPILFRDIKPSNIILSADGRVKLVDFGCACREGDKSGIAGTAGFGAPEQFEPGNSPTITADIYGLGKTLQAAGGKNCDNRLRAVIRRCTGILPTERLPDMGWAEELLSVCCETGCHGKFSNLQKAVLRGKIRVEKNIWLYEYENT